MQVNYANHAKTYMGEFRILQRQIEGILHIYYCPFQID